MKSTLAALSFVCGAFAGAHGGDYKFWPNNGTDYTTITTTAITTYCPSSTAITHGTRTYIVTEATTLTITDCPCTVIKVRPSVLVLVILLPCLSRLDTNVRQPVTSVLTPTAYTYTTCNSSGAQSAGPSNGVVTGPTSSLTGVVYTIPTSGASTSEGLTTAAPQICPGLGCATGTSTSSSTFTIVTGAANVNNRIGSAGPILGALVGFVGLAL